MVAGKSFDKSDGQRASARKDERARGRQGESADH